MCHSGLCGIVGKLAWLIVSFAALNTGLAAANVFDFNALSFVANNPQTKMIIDYVVGVAGALSLFGLVAHSYRCMSGTCDACKMGK